MFNHSALHYYFLLFFTCTCLARQQCQFKQECQLDTIHALKPDNLIESQGGVTETWNASHPELCCAGVAFIKRTINPNGLHLPSYVNYPELHFVLQGEGVLGIVIPGCDETFEEPQREREHDRHQKVRYLKQGDIFAVPPGIPYWTYNYANVSLVVITLLDTANFENQLDRVPRRFYLAGNPKEEHPCGRKQEEGNNINMFGGFDPRFLAEASNVKVGITKKLQSHIGDQIIKVEKGLSIIRPPLEHEVREAEVEEKPKTREHCECQKERKHKEGEGEEEVVQEKEIRKRKHHIGEHEGCGECENKEEEEQSRSRERGEWHEHKGQQHGKEKGRERYKEGGEGRERSNVLEEILCTLKLHENIADPSHADIFNPRAGRVRTINSLTLPVLKLLRLSAQWVKLYKSGIYVPHWSMNANSVAYVTSGGGWVQVVNSQGKSVFSGAVGRGRVVVVPQNFAVAIQAGRDGMEYIVFRTNDRAMMGTLVGPTSAITAIPGEVLANAFGLSPEEVSELKNNRKEAVLSSPASHHSPNPLIVTICSGRETRYSRLPLHSEQRQMHGTILERETSTVTPLEGFPYKAWQVKTLVIKALVSHAAAASQANNNNFLRLRLSLPPARKAWKSFTSTLGKLHKSKSKAMKKPRKHYSKTTTKKVTKAPPKFLATKRFRSKKLALATVRSFIFGFHKKPAPVYIDKLFREPSCDLVGHLKPQTAHKPRTERLSGGEETTKGCGSCSSDDVWESLALASPQMQGIDERAEEFITRFRQEMAEQEMIARNL
ncbi:hypothetical protein JHK84_053697 [Glycine max]|nr:hypothetical protein JHK86_053672 [Glycine max]KAG5083659.1 hypothetical protein JHK84_053697 [Glycine max]